MKVLAINGSYRVNGNTARIIEMLAAHMGEIATGEGSDIEFETVHLGRANIAFCRGCRACFDLGEEKCPLNDDLLSIHKGPVGTVISEDHLFSAKLNGAVPPRHTGQFTLYAYINPFLGTASTDNQSSIREGVGDGTVEYVGRRRFPIGYGFHSKMISGTGPFSPLPGTAGQQRDPNLWAGGLLPEI